MIATHKTLSLVHPRHGSQFKPGDRSAVVFLVLHDGNILCEPLVSKELADAFVDGFNAKRHRDDGKAIVREIHLALAIGSRSIIVAEGSAA